MDGVICAHEFAVEAVAWVEVESGEEWHDDSFEVRVGKFVLFGVHEVFCVVQSQEQNRDGEVFAEGVPEGEEH